MNTLKLIDVTLRDGGHLSHFHFQPEAVESWLTCLDKAGIDYIEVGYRNGSISFIEDLGAAGFCDESFLNLCKRYLKQSHMAVMAHCDNISLDDLIQMNQLGVKLVRLCIKRGEHDKALPLISQAKDLGLEVSTNLIHISQYSQDEAFHVAQKLSQYKPSMIYFADSNGCMSPSKVEALIRRCLALDEVPLGFHAHDHLGLAQTNAIAAVESGVSFIDASLAGVGKGLGNLRLEFFVAYLKRFHQSNYSLGPLIEASNGVRQTLLKYGLLDKHEFLRGLKDLSTKQVASYLRDNPDEV